MTNEIARAMGTNLTYGWLIASAPSETGLRGGTSQVLIAGDIVTIGGDIMIAVNGTRIVNLDDLSTYLEEHTLPGQTITATIIRNDQPMDLMVKLEKRPPPSAA